MHTLEATRQLIMDMAPIVTEIEEIQETEDGTWGFGFFDDSVMTAEWANEPSRLVLTCFLGAPPRERRLEACELLLSFNQMGVENGGVRGGMAADGELTLIHDLPAAPLTAIEFREAILNFAALGRKWSQTIRAELDAQPPGVQRAFGRCKHLQETSMSNNLSNLPRLRLESQQLISKNLKLTLQIQQMKSGDIPMRLRGDGALKRTAKHGLGERVISRLKDVGGRRAAMESGLDRYFSLGFEEAKEGSKRTTDIATKFYVGFIRKEVMKSQFNVAHVLELVDLWQQALGVPPDPEESPRASPPTAVTNAPPKGTPHGSGPRRTRTRPAEVERRTCAAARA